MTRQIKGLCGAIVLVLAGQATAATTWTLNTAPVTAGGVTASATGWADTGSASALQQQPAGTNFVLYSGLGLGINNLNGCASPCSGDVGDLINTPPEHAIDNNQRYEMVLVSFNNSVNITGATYGWTGNNDSGVSGAGSETTVLAYNGAAITQAALLTQLATETWGTLTGWAKIANYANTTDNTVVSTGTGMFSSYWLIGAYNPLAGGASTGFTDQNDYVKLKTVIGTVQTTQKSSVPEPGSLALIGLALVGMLYTRRRRFA